MSFYFSFQLPIYRLDVDGNGELDAADFRDDFAAIDQQKKQMYAIILEKFDFDDNKSISKQEFYDGFILMAWTDSDVDTGFTRQQLATDSPHNLGNLFHDWVLNFNMAIENQIKRLGHELNYGFQGPSEDSGQPAANPAAGVVAEAIGAPPSGYLPTNRIATLFGEFPSGVQHPMETQENRKRQKGWFQR